jgi:hypothetical protein
MVPIPTRPSARHSLLLLGCMTSWQFRYKRNFLPAPPPLSLPLPHPQVVNPLFSSVL